MKTTEQLKIFQQKMSHIISLKVTKFQQPLLITLGAADEKPEGGQQAPPPPSPPPEWHRVNSFIVCFKKLLRDFGLEFEIYPNL